MANRVGGDIDSYCTRCKMLLGHTILAMVGDRVARVRCNTCQGEHVYKSGAPGEAKPRASSGTGTRSTGTRAKAEVISFDDTIASKDVGNAKAYSVNEKFALDQVIDHPTFGRGFVSAVRPDKVDVTFKSFVKTLVHGRGGKPAPARPQPMGKPQPEADDEAPGAPVESQGDAV